MRLVVVIQGPLVTYGQGPNNSSNGFSVAETVKKNISAITEEQLPYIYVTWPPKNPTENRILYELKANKLNVSVINVPRWDDPDHRRKHHFSIRRGIELLGLVGNPSDYWVLKLRSDMTMPPSFWSWSKLIVAENDDRLYVSELYRAPFLMGDFIYLAKLNVMLSFLECIEKYGPFKFHPSISSDISVKYSISRGVSTNYMGGFGRLRFLAGSLLLTKKYIRSWNQVLETSLATMPEPIWQEIEWRGRKMRLILDSTGFVFHATCVVTEGNVVRRLANLINDFRRLSSASGASGPLRRLAKGFLKRG